MLLKLCGKEDSVIKINEYVDKTDKEYCGKGVYVYMKISRLFVKNYRNIKHIDIQLSDVVAVIGENNSGKSNLLRALTLPFLADDAGYMGKTLSWIDIT